LKISQTIFKDFGVLKYVFNQNLDSRLEIIESIGIKPVVELKKDTLFLWYSENTLDSASVIIDFEQMGLDTFNFFIPEPKESELFLQKPSTNYPIPMLNGNPFVLEFNTPIEKIDSNKIHFFKDSVELDYPKPTLQLRNLVFDLPLDEGFNYKISLEPGSIFNIFGSSNKDSIELNIRGEQFKNYGNLDLKLTGLDTTLAYIVELFPSENEPPVFRRFFQNKIEFQESFKGLNPGNYFLNIISDLNQNKKWDTGNIHLKIQPEPIVREEVKGIRANWDFELLIEL
jgi:hypothetical protein